MPTIYTRGDVVKGPDTVGPHEERPFVCLSNETHPFSDEEALYAAVTTSRRSIAIPLADSDFVTGGLPEESYVNPWTVTILKHADIIKLEGRLDEATTRSITQRASEYLTADD